MGMAWGVRERDAKGGIVMDTIMLEHKVWSARVRFMLEPEPYFLLKHDRVHHYSLPFTPAPPLVMDTIMLEHDHVRYNPLPFRHAPPLMIDTIMLEHKVWGARG